VDYALSPGAYAHAHSGADGFTGGVTLYYYFDITGGNFFDSVPLSIDYALAAHAGGPTSGDVDDASADIRVSAANGNSNQIASVFCGNTIRGASCDAPLSGTLHLTGWVGYINTIQLDVSATISGNGFADALADPHVYIDPAFLTDHPGYGLAFSPSVGNSLAGVPEPASLFLVGCALLAGSLCLRRRTRVEPS
jgi:hypothetical protein